MLAQLLVVCTIGLLTGTVMGALASRNKKKILMYALAGMAGGLAIGCLPLIRGSGYINTSYKPVVIISGLFTGIAILFSSAK